MAQRATHDEQFAPTASQFAEFAHSARGQILQDCSTSERTNQELAVSLGLDPATSLFHIRHLVDAGLLDELPPRRGTRGGREKPYVLSPVARAALTQLNRSAIWQSTVIGLSEARLESLERELTELLNRYRTNPTDPIASVRSVTVTLHGIEGP